VLIPHGTVIAVVDGEKFELHRNAGNEAAPEIAQVDAPKLHEHNKDSGARHISSAANPTGHLLDEDAHAAAVATWLNQQVVSRNIEHLIVVAPPRTLGELRRRYDSALKGVLFSELDKEMTGRTGQDILDALRSK
jgi:protein required for attachment to host cells